MVRAKRPRVNKTAQRHADDHGKIALVAYELFEHRGRTHGKDRDDWFEAQRILAQRRRSSL